MRAILLVVARTPSSLAGQVDSANNRSSCRSYSAGTGTELPRGKMSFSTHSKLGVRGGLRHRLLLVLGAALGGVEHAVELVEVRGRLLRVET